MLAGIILNKKMTKHTIQYEEVVEQTEDVAVCNGCGTEVEEAVETYVSRGHGETTEIHLHQQCEADLLATSEPDSESSNWNRVPNLEVPETIGVYLTSIKYIAAFAFLPLTFVQVTRFLDKHEDGEPEGAVLFMFCIWLVAAFVGVSVIL